MNLFSNSLEGIDFSIGATEYPEWQKQRERSLQHDAGIPMSEDFEGVRNQLALANNEVEMEDLYKGSDMALQQGASPESVANYITNYTPSNAPEAVDTSLEVAAADNIVAEAYEVNEQKAVNAVSDPFAAEETWRIANSYTFDGFIEDMEHTMEGEPAYRHVEGWTRQLALPTMLEVGEVAAMLGIDPKITPQGLGDALYSVTTKQAAALSPQEFDKWLKEGLEPVVMRLDPVARQDVLNKMRYPTSRAEDFPIAMDLMPFGISGSKATAKAKAAGNTKKFREVAEDLFREGNKERFVNETLMPSAFDASKAANESSIIDAEYEIVEALPGHSFVDLDDASWAVKEADDINEMLVDSMANDVLAGLSEDDDLLKIVKGYTVDGVLTENDKKLALNALKNKIMEKMFINNGKIVDVDYMIEEDPWIGTYSAVAKIGFGRSGTEALDYESAKNIAKGMGLEEGMYRIVKGDGEGYYISYRLPVTATLDNTPTESGRMSTYLPLRILRGPTKQSDVIRNVMLQAERFQNNLLKEFNDVLISKYNGLSTLQKQQVAELYVTGQKLNKGKGAWVSFEEAMKKNIDPKAYEVYEQMQEVDKALHYAMNAQLNRRLTDAGYYDFNNGAFIGKPVEAFKVSQYEFDHGKFYMMNQYGEVANEPIQFNIETSLSEFWKAFENDEVVRIANIGGIGDMESLEFVIIPKGSSVSRQAIKRMLVPYTGGGRRIYQAGTIFIKQGTSGRSSKGVKYYGHARVITTASDTKTAKKYVDKANALIDIWNKYPKNKKGYFANEVAAKIVRELSQLDQSVLPCQTIDDFVVLFKGEDGKRALLNAEHKLQAITHEGQKYLYPVDGTVQIGDDLGGFVDDNTALLLTRKNLKSFNRGYILDSINSTDGFAPLADASEIIDATVNRIVQTNTLKEANATFAREFSRNFMDVIDTSKINPEGKNVEWLLINAPFKSKKEIGGNKGMLKKVRAAERLRDVYNLLNNKVETVEEAFTNRLFGYHGLNLLDKMGIKRNPAAIKALLKTNPIAGARNLIYRFALGLWNPVQFGKQFILPVLQTCFTAHPIASTRIMTAMPSILTALLSGVEDAAVFKTLHKFSGLGEKDFNDLIAFLKKAGSANMARSRPSVGSNFGKPSTISTGLDKFCNNAVLRSSDMFINAGINLNYVFADSVAWMISKDRGNFNKLLRKADALSLSMSRASRSKLQAIDPGVTQFLTAQFRILELLTGSKELTKTEKLSIIFGNMALWGVPGTLGIKALRTAPDPDDTLLEQIYNQGAINLMLKETGYTLQGWGPEAFGFIDDLLEVYNGKRGFMQIRAPVINVVNNTTALIDAITQFVCPATGYDKRNFYMTLASTPDLLKSLKIGGKILYGMDAGVLLDSQGDILADDFEFKDALMAVIGAVPNKEMALRELRGKAHDYNQDIQDARETVQAESKRINLMNNNLNYGKPENPQDLKAQILKAEQNLRIIITETAKLIDAKHGTSTAYVDIMSGYYKDFQQYSTYKFYKANYKGIPPAFWHGIQRYYNTDLENMNGK